METSQLIDAVKKMQQGDISSLSVVYKETSGQVYKILYSYTKDEQLSLDLMQDTYITLSQKICNVEHPEFISKFINTVAINKARNYYKKSTKEILLSENSTEIFEELIEEDIDFLPQEILESREKQKIIKGIIDELPLEQKTAVYLYYYNELSVSEIAYEMNCSDGTVKSRLNYARKKIKCEVDSWEKKGTKLYSTSVPVLLFLLRNEISEVQVPLESINSLLKNIINTGAGIIAAGTTVSAESGSASVTKAALSVKKAITMKIIAGATVISVISAVALLNNKEHKEKSVYYAYSSIGIEKGIIDIKSQGDNVYLTTMNDEERYLKFEKKENIDSGMDNVIITDTEKNEYKMTVIVQNGEMDVSIDNIENDCEYIPYKELTDGYITNINVKDNYIVNVFNEEDNHDIKIEAIGVGSTSVKLNDNKGKKYEFTVTIGINENNSLFIQTITNTKK